MLIAWIVKSAYDGICVCHNISKYPFVRFTYWNERMAQITGYTVEEINKLGWYQTMYPDRELQEKAIKRMSNMRKDEHLISEEWTITRKDGKNRILSMSTSVLFSKGKQTNVIAFIRDITEQKRAEPALRENEENIEPFLKICLELWLCLVWMARS